MMLTTKHKKIDLENLTKGQLDLGTYLLQEMVYTNDISPSTADIWLGKLKKRQLSEWQKQARNAKTKRTRLKRQLVKDTTKKDELKNNIILLSQGQTKNNIEDRLKVLEKEIEERNAHIAHLDEFINDLHSKIKSLENNIEILQQELDKHKHTHRPPTSKNTELLILKLAKQGMNGTNISKALADQGITYGSRSVQKKLREFRNNGLLPPKKSK